MNNYLILHERIEPGRKELELLNVYPPIRAWSAEAARVKFQSRYVVKLGDSERLHVRRAS